MSAPVIDGVQLSMSLRDVLHMLRRRKWLALSVLTLVAGAAVAITMAATPMYRAEAEVLIRTEETANLFPLPEVGTLLRSPSGEEGFLSSTEFESAAQEAAGSDILATIDVGDVTSRVEPSLIRFTVEAADPELAAQVAQSWADTYVNIRHSRDVAEVSRTLTTLVGSIDELDGQKQLVLDALEPIETLLSRTTDAGEIASLSTQRVVLLQQLESNLDPIEQQLTLLNLEAANLRLIEQFMDTSDLSARMNRVARVPEVPFSPSLPKNLALGSILGILAAVGVVMLRESLDEGFRSTEDVYEKTGLQPLTHVPLQSNSRPNHREVGLLAEAFERLASSVVRSSDQVLVFTSAVSGEAKTSTVAGLGRTLARHGRKTLVIGADLRRPTLAASFGQSRGPGVGEVLSGLYPFRDCLVSADPDSGLQLLPAGTVPDGKNPAELLRGHEFRTLINELRAEYDNILIDCPPLLPVVDALNVAEIADGIVLHVFGGRTRLGTLQRSLALVDRAVLSAPVVGFVYTGKHVGHESNYYDYNYGFTPPPSRSMRSWKSKSIAGDIADAGRNVDVNGSLMDLSGGSSEGVHRGKAFEQPVVTTGAVLVETRQQGAASSSLPITEVDFGGPKASDTGGLEVEMLETKKKTRKWRKK